MKNKQTKTTKTKSLKDYKLKAYAKVLGSSQSSGMTRLYMAFGQNNK